MNKYEKELAAIGMEILEQTMLGVLMISFLRDIISQEEFVEKVSESPLITRETIPDCVSNMKSLKRSPEKIKTAASIDLTKNVTFRYLIKKYPLITECLNKVYGDNLSSKLEELMETLGNMINPSGNWKGPHGH